MMGHAADNASVSIETARLEWEEIDALSDHMRDNEEAWTHAHGVRDGYEQAVQMMDRLTGGDGEFSAECPTPADMMARILARVAA